jgi:hypothetical protein
MSWNDTLLIDLQTDVKARLENDGFFSDLSVLLKRDGVTEHTLKVELGPDGNAKSGKTGACVIIHLPEIAEHEGETPGPMLVVELPIQVFEAPEINNGSVGTGKSCEQIGLHVINLLHNYADNKHGWVMQPAPRPMQAQDPDRADWISAIVRMQFHSGLTRTSKCGMPLPSQDGNNDIVLTCGTPGAAIWYTLDGSYPGPANEEATLYAAPIDPGAATVLRAVAYKDEFIASDALHSLLVDA